MNIEKLKKLIGNIKKGKIDTIQALDALKTLPFEEMEFATLDTHRSLRQGFPEVILGQGKNHLQIVKIVKSMRAKKENILVTRVDEDKARSIKRAVPQTVYNKIARTLFIQSHPVKAIGKGTILVICAGTSDMPVAEEAADPFPAAHADRLQSRLASARCACRPLAQRSSTAIRARRRAGLRCSARCTTTCTCWAPRPSWRSWMGRASPAPWAYQAGCW